MAYTPQQWHDDTTSDPYGPISGDRLNYIESGIQAAAAAADAAGTAAGGTATPLGTAAPVINGVAAAGTSGSAAHEDHVHPTDTSRAALASPTFTGHPVGVTEAALNNSTRLATTAYTDTAVGVETTRATTAEGLLAPLASPTFSGTPSLPTASVAVTQSAADSTTKLATTAFVTTADNLKANLAGPTFTGTVTLPSTTVAVTPSASDNSTKPATTAYVDTADNLKANLASPTFTGTATIPNIAGPTTLAGTVTLPSTTAAVTASASDNSTKPATTAYVDAADALRVFSGGFMSMGVNSYCWPCHPTMANSTSVTMSAANAARTLRVTMGKTGTLHDLTVFIFTTGGNGKLLIYDTGQANGGDHTVRTLLKNSGTVATPAQFAAMTYDPALSVTAGDELEFAVTFDSGTAAVYGTNAGNGGFMQMPTGFVAPNGTGTVLPKLTAAPTSMYATPPSTITDTLWTLTNAGKTPLFVWRIT